jgi:hypothetical protein
MKVKNFTALKNTFYIIYISVSAFFLMNDFKITTMIMMVILAPTILFMEHHEAKNASE